MATENKKSVFLKIMSKLSNFGMDYTDLLQPTAQKTQNLAPLSNGTFHKSNNDGEFEQWEQFGRLNSSDSFTRKSIAYFDQPYSQKRNELRRYAQQDEIEEILDTLCDEAIVFDDENFFCTHSNYNDPSMGEKQLLLIQEALQENFDRLYVYWGFNSDIAAWQYFRKFLIEGYLAFEIIYSKDNKSIIGFIELDPLSLIPQIKNNEKVWFLNKGDVSERILFDSQVIYISYGQNNIYGRVSYVERLIRTFNIMRLMEHSRIIWAVVNASFRTKFIIPVGGKSKNRQKQSLASLMQSYREVIDFSEDSGELKVNGKAMMPFNKEYWFPETENGTPQMETVGNDGADLSDTESLKYFRNKLIRVSKIPMSRFDSEGGDSTFGVGAEGMTRDEIKFGRFVNRLRSAFQEIIIKPLWLQMCLDFNELSQDVKFKGSVGVTFNKNNLFEEMKELEVLTKRASFIKEINESITEKNEEGDEEPYFSPEFLVRKFLKIPHEDLKENRKFKILDRKQRQATKENATLKDFDDAGYSGGQSDPFIDVDEIESEADTKLDDLDSNSEENQNASIASKDDRATNLVNEPLPDIPEPKSNDNLETSEKP